MARRCTREALGLLAAAAVIGAAAPAAAQGPRWTLTPGIAVSQSFDDNVRLNNQNPDPDVDETVGDFTTGIRPWADVSFNGRHTLFSANYEVSFLRYAELDRLNRFQQHGRVSLRHQISRRWALFARDSFSVTPSTDEALDEVVGGVVFRRVGARVNDATAGFETQLTRNTSVDGSYSFQTIRFDRDEDVDAHLRGGTGHGLASALRHRLSKRVTIGADYVYRHATLLDDTATFDVQSVQGALDLEIAEGMSLSAGLGLAHLSAPDRTQSGPAYRLGWSYGTYRTSFSVSYRKAYVPSFGFGGTFDNQELRGSGSYLFTRRLYVSGLYSLRQADALTPGEEPFLSSRMSGRFGYALARWANVEAFYMLTHQNARRAGGIVDRNRFGIQLTTSTRLRMR